jgi:DNA primase
MARRIPETVLEEIRDRVDIVSTIGEYVTLKKSGRNYKGLCPFHREKTPSFNVSPERGIFHCFGCGAGGNIFTFLMRMEGMSFQEAVKALADRVGVELSASTAEEAARASQKQRLLSAARQVARLYRRYLLEAREAEVARRYLDRRGVSQEASEAFELGYAPDRWDFLIQKAPSLKISQSELETLGLIIQRERSEGFYDRFRGRLIFPIKDSRGEVVGFGGRLIDDTSEGAKYINTPETLLYQKRRLLYGIDLARKAAQHKGELIVAEGYLDVITAHQFGVKNMVATLGTAFTEHHARLIRRYVQRVVLVFDADQAGAEAARRGAEMLVEQGLEVSVMTLPAGEDPDSFLRSKGLEAFQEALERAEPLVDFLLARADTSTASAKGRAAREILGVVSRIPSRVEQAETLRRVSHRLRVPEEALWEEYRRLRAEAKPGRAGAPSDTALPSGETWPEEALLLRILLQEPALQEAKELGFKPQGLRDPKLRSIAEALIHINPSGKVDIASLLDHLQEPELADQALGLYHEPHGLEDYRSGLRDCLEQVAARGLREEIERLDQALREAEEAGDMEQVRELARQRMELQRMGLT